MILLTFKSEEVSRLVQHSLSCKEHSDAGGKKANEPTVMLAHDNGVYLMSGGLPRDIVRGETSYVAYAEGCDPEDEGWWERSRSLVGGDDFVVYLPWARAIKAKIDEGNKKISIYVDASKVKML